MASCRWPCSCTGTRSVDYRPKVARFGWLPARGPLALASWLLGITELMVALKRQPERTAQVLDVLTETIIVWLRAQAEAVGGVEGILLLDDIPGMLSPKLFDALAAPYLARIFEAFDGLVRVYHNDTPCPHLLTRLAALPFEVFNFSHETDIVAVRAAMPAHVLMGNVPPLAVMAQGAPDQVQAWARACIEKTGGRGLILSAGGGVSPGTPAENIDALVAAALCVMSVSQTRFLGETWFVKRERWSRQ